MKRKTFNDWYQRADLHIPYLRPRQSMLVRRLLQKAYCAGRKHERERNHD
jgi:hypothetical protein